MAKAIVKNGVAEIQAESGSLINRIGNGDVVQADINPAGSMILLTLSNGRVELRNKEGILIYTLGVLKAAAARFVGNGILVKFPS